MGNIDIIHTPCKNCVFAQYEEKKTQTGCHLDYLSKLKNNGVEIIEAYDNDLEFFIVNNKKCLGYRENSWFVQFRIENAPIETKIAKLKELNRIDYVLVINFLEIGSSESDLNNLAEALSSLSIHPRKMVFVRGPEGNETTIYASINKLMTRAKINCQWRIQTMVDDTLDNNSILHNIINSNKNHRFVCQIKKSNCVDGLDKVITEANRIVYDELGQFIVLSDKDVSCLVFGNGVYRYAIVEDGKDILSDTSSFQIV